MRKKKSRAALGVWMGILMFLAAALVIILQSRVLFEGKVQRDGAYTSVMADVAGIREADPRVVDLAMLASHNANTYALASFKGLSGEADSAMMRRLYGAAWGAVYRYTKNQVSDVYEQLCQGTRFLQFRCSYYGGVWMGSHTAVDGPMATYIRDVIRFLQGAPGEIAVLDFRFRYCEQFCLADAAKELFHIDYNGATLLDFIPYEDVPLGELTYNTVTQNGTKGGAVVVFDVTSASGSADVREESTEYRGKTYVYKVFYEYGGGSPYRPMVQQNDAVGHRRGPHGAMREDAGRPRTA